MRSFWLDPYLWVHLAGVAVVPIALEGCLLGLAASNSLLPPWVELILVGSIGAAPILWMQWQRPFCIYSLMFLALQPRKLTEDQRRILRRFQLPLVKGLSFVTAGVLLAALWQIYQIAPIAWESASVVPGGALGGLLLASISFLFANLFLQVPVSVAQVMLTDERTIAATEPYPVNAVARDFTLVGIRVNRILPSLKAEPALATAGASASPQTASPQTVSSQTVSSQTASSQTIDRKADRPVRTTPTRFKDPQPSASNPQTSAKADANLTGGNSARGNSAAPKPKRPVVPVEVIDAEFRELNVDDEWDEVIVSGEESLTDHPRSETQQSETQQSETQQPETQQSKTLTEVKTAAVEAIPAEFPNTDTPEITTSETKDFETDSLETGSPEVSNFELDNPEVNSSGAAHPTTISAETIAQIFIGTESDTVIDTEPDTVLGTVSGTPLRIASDIVIEITLDAAPKIEIDTNSGIVPDTIVSDTGEGTIGDLPESNAPESNALESTDESAELLQFPETSPESASIEPPASPEIPEITAVLEELLQPTPEPEELPALNQTRLSGEDLLISAMTLIESEDVSEGAAVDVSAVEVVTAEIVEDVSEDAAVPAETIETWLEDDWEEETV